MEMKTNNVVLANTKSQLSYESPRVDTLRIEMEYGIASGSVEPAANKQWEETESQSHEVNNNFWN